MDNDIRTPEEKRAERMRILRIQRAIRIAALALAIVLALISLCVSCSTQKAVKELAATIAAKKAAQAQETLLQEQTEAPQEEVQPVEYSEDRITMSFVGDCTLSRHQYASYEGSFEEYYDLYGDTYFFQNVKSIFEGDDLTIANFEGTLTESTNMMDKMWTFKADPSYVSILKEGGIDVVNVANNHTRDYGDEGYVDTLANLDNAGIGRFGNDYVMTMEVKGVTIGFSGIYECELGAACQDQAVENVQRLKEMGAELIICEFHWGDENSYTPNPIHTVLAHAVIDAGADLVVAHHPHVLQGIEQYQGKYICYSLGNFCFGGNDGVKDKDTMIFQIGFPVKNGEIQKDTEYSIIPCSISTDPTVNTYCPTPATGEEAQRIVDKVYEMSAQLDGGVVRPT
ncbi:MAG: CapA family protein [Oscillospiraceae bacterium]|nr:CapA family protein [Oscillospiraceae bacterium]